MEIPIQFPVTTPHRKSIGNSESGPSVWLLLFFRVFNYTVPDLEGIRYICARVYVCVCVCVCVWKRIFVASWSMTYLLTR